MRTCFCFICGTNEAQELETDQDGIGIACAGCSSYVITCEAIAEMERHGYTFNVDVARAWLSDRQGSGEIPLITWNDAAKLI